MTAEARQLKDAVDQFLIDEAELLDSWRLKEWEALFTDDGRYLIPPLNEPEAATIEQGKVLFLAHDGRPMITGRVERLLKKSAYVESPRSNVRHMISNVRILSDGGDTLRVRSNFLVYRARRGQITEYVGQVFHILVRSGDCFRIREKRVCLDNDILQPQGSIGIIL